MKKKLKRGEEIVEAPARLTTAQAIELLKDLPNQICSTKDDVINRSPVVEFSFGPGGLKLESVEERKPAVAKKQLFCNMHKPGVMCGFILVGGRYCGKPEEKCEHQGEVET